MKYVLLILISIFLSNTSVKAQNLKEKFNYERAREIALDSIWLKNGIWKQLGFMKHNNPIYKIRNEKEAKKTSFIIMPYYEISKKGISYKYRDDFADIIKLDTTCFFAFIKLKNKIVGYFDAIYTNHKWDNFFIGLIEDENFLETAYQEIIKLNPDYIFRIKRLDGLWFIKNNQVSVYCFYNYKIMTVEKYLKNNKTHTLKDIRDFANGKE